MRKLDLVLSVWKPWNLALPPNRISIAAQVQTAVTLGVRAIVIKGTNRNVIYGAKEKMLPPWRNYSNDHLEQEAKAQGLEVDLWCWADMRHPSIQAQVIKDAAARWNPRNIFIDCEGGIAKAYAHNTGAFLRNLGHLYRHDGTRIKVYLQSYRRPSLHPEIAWIKWLSYKLDGAYIIDGVAPQAYYVGTQDSVTDYERMLLDYSRIEVVIDRVLRWHVTLPTYREHGWQPTPESLEAGMDFLRNSLGNLLVGFNFFRLGWLMNEQLTGVWTMLLAYDWGDEEEPEPEPIPFEQQPEPERWIVVAKDLRCRGVINGGT